MIRAQKNYPKRLFLALQRSSSLMEELCEHPEGNCSLED